MSNDTTTQRLLFSGVRLVGGFANLEVLAFLDTESKLDYVVAIAKIRG